MTTIATGMTASSNAARFVLWTGRGLEILWLVTVVMVPLAFIDRDYAVSEAVISYVEVPKIALLRMLAGLMATLWLLEWAIQGQMPDPSKLNGRWTVARLSAGWAALASWLRDRPTRWLILAVWFFLVTTLTSTILSGSIKTSVWGEIPGQDGYGAYTVASYLVIFGVIATHLRTRPQLWRLLGAIVAMGTLVAGYAVLQHYGRDFLDLTEQTGGGASRRVTSFMGNAIFAAAVMTMTIPISMATAALSIREPDLAARKLKANARRMTRSLTIMALWSLVLAVQLLGLTFTFSRGPWVGTLVAVVCFLGLGLLFLGWRVSGRVVLLLGLSGAVAAGILQGMGSVSILGQGPWFAAVIIVVGLLGTAAILTNWRSLGWAGLLAGVVVALAAGLVLAPGLLKSVGSSGEETSAAVDSPETTTGEVSERFSSIRTEVLGGFIGGRGTHWQISWRLMRQRPWFEFDHLSLPWLRPLIGYGPDLFRYTYLLESPPEGRDFYPLEPDQAHNYFIHQGVEQGFAGLFSALGIFTAVFLVSRHHLVKRRNDLSQVHKVIMVALAATLMGRFIEMNVGVARVSDLTVLWVLLATFAALSQVMRNSPQGVDSSPRQPQRSNRRRNRSPANPSSAPGSYDWRLFWRLAVVVLVLGGITMVTWIKGVNYVRAAVAEATAVRQFKSGDWQSSLESLDRAIKLAPDVPSYYNNLAQVFLAYQVNQNVPAEQSCTAQDEIPYHVCLAVNGYQSNLIGAKQRPFYYRSQTALGDSANNLGLGDRAVESFRSSVALVPGSWQDKNNLAAAYIVAEQYEEALDILEKSLSITGDNQISADAYFLKGEAYRNLGELDRSAQLTEQSLNLKLSGYRAAQSHYTLGQYHANAGRLGAAIDNLNLAIEIGPAGSPVYALRGKVFSEIGEHQLAIEDFEEAIRLNPEQQLDRGRMGVSYFELGQYDDAIMAFDEAVRLDSRDGTALAYRGKAYSDLGQQEQGLLDLDEAIRIRPQDAVPYYLRGSAYFSLDRPLAALQDLNTAILIDPADPNQYVVRGDVRNSLGQFAQAESDYAAAVRLRSTTKPVAPDILEADLAKAVNQDRLDPKTYIERGRAYHSLGQYGEAIADFDQAISLDPDAAQPYVDRGLAYIGLGQYYRAIKDLDFAIERMRGHFYSGVPMFFPYFFNRGLAHFNLGNYDQAIKDLDSAIKRFDHPGRAEAFVIRGIAYGQLGRDDLADQDLTRFTHAVENLERGFQLNPQDSKVFYTRGLALFHLGQYLRSIVYFDRSISLDPRAPLAHLGRAFANSELGRYQLVISDINEALKLFEHSLAKAGDSRVVADAFFLQGHAYDTLGQSDQATQSMARGLELGLDGDAAVQANLIVSGVAEPVRLYPLDSRAYELQDLNDAIQANPQDPVAYYLRGSARFSDGLDSDALRDLDQAIRFDSSEPKYFSLRGDVHNSLGRPENAARDYAMALRLTSTASLPRTTASSSELATAIEQFDVAIGEDPGSAQTYIDRGIARIGLGEYQRAMQDLDVAIGMMKGHFYTRWSSFFPYLYNRALAYFNLGLYEKAIADLDSAIELFKHHPDAAEAFVMRGNSYAQLGRDDLAIRDLAPFRKAVDDLERGFRLNPQGPKVLYSRGLAFLHIGQFLRSIAYFDQALQLDPDDPLPYISRGLANAHLGRNQQATQDVNRALVIFEQSLPRVGENRFSANALFLQSQAYQNLGHSDAALKLLTLAIRLHPGDPRAHINRANAYHGLSRYSEAISDFDRAIGLFQNRRDAAQSYVERGLAYIGLGQYRSAVADLDQAIDQIQGHAYTGDSKFFPYFFSRALAYFNLGSYQMAIKDLDLAISFDHPDIAEAFLIRGVSYGLLGKDALATRDLEQFDKSEVELARRFRLHPQDSKVYFTRGLALLHVGRYQQGIDFFDQAIQLDPGDPVPYISRGLANAHLGRNRQATRDIDRAMEIFEESLPGVGENRFSAEALSLQGKAYQNLGLADSAIKLLTLAIRLHPDNPQAYINRAKAYHDMSRYNEAVAEFDQAIGLFQDRRDSAQTYVDRGLAYVGQRQYKRAIEDFDDAINRKKGHFYSGDPVFFNYFFNRALAYFNLGSYQMAIKDLDSAITFDHSDIAEAYLYRGISYGLLGQDALAMEDLSRLGNADTNLERGFRLNPQDSKVYYTRGLTFFYLGRYQQAIDNFDQAIQLDPSDPLFREERGLAIAKLAQN